MVFAIRHGVLGYEAMGLNRLFLNLPFGVFIYEATRTGQMMLDVCANLLDDAPWFAMGGHFSDSMASIHVRVQSNPAESVS